MNGIQPLRKKKELCILASWRHMMASNIIWYFSDFHNRTRQNGLVHACFFSIASSSSHASSKLCLSCDLLVRVGRATGGGNELPPGETRTAPASAIFLGTDDLPALSQLTNRLSWQAVREATSLAWGTMCKQLPVSSLSASYFSSPSLYIQIQRSMFTTSVYLS